MASRSSERSVRNVEGPARRPALPARLAALGAVALTLTVAPVLAAVFAADVSGKAPAVSSSAGTRSVRPPTLTPAELDRLVDQYLKTSKAPAAAVTTDVEFVRRIYLDVTGRLPDPDETRAFVTSRDSAKRARLVDALLDSPEYAGNWARYWRDVIKYHATNQNAGQVGYQSLESWLKTQLAANTPWDKVATGLITASGRSDENGAVGFGLSHETSAVEMAGEVSRIFLGVQIQCAQCHDHPNDSWKRQQFHEFAAFFAGAKSKRAYDPKVIAKAKAEGKTKEQIRAIVKKAAGKQAFEVVLQGRPKYTMPDLKDPTKLIPVEPKFFLASEDAAAKVPAGLSAAARFEHAATLVTSQDNPWFAKAYVNRVWYALMGDSFYAPVDDLGPNRTAKAPEVLEALASQWQNGGYDVKWLYRTILNSKVYQREVRSTASESGRTAFAANCAGRLRSDQILDSLSQVLGMPIPGEGPGRMGPEGPVVRKVAGKKGAGIAADFKDAKTKGSRPGLNPRGGFDAVFGYDPSTPGDDVLGTIPQALALMNGPQINQAIVARPGTVLGAILTSTDDNRAALNALYLRVFAREPTAQEVKTCGKYLDAVGNRREAFEDILWGMINSTEFITRR